MNTKHTLLTGALLGSTITLSALLLLGVAPPRAAHATNRDQWEYTYSSPKATNDELNRLGRSDWEGFAVTPEGQVAFKRPRYR
jgi:hypothetical protein